MTNRRRRKPEQIVKLLQEGEAMLLAGKTLGGVLQQLEVKESTWLRWKKHYGCMKSDEDKRLKELEIENRRLKEMLAEAELDKRILKEDIEGNYYARLDDVKPSSTFKKRVRSQAPAEFALQCVTSVPGEIPPPAPSLPPLQRHTADLLS